MAKQIGTLKVQGTIDDITFAQTADGYIAKKKTFLSASKLKNSPSYQRTRETMAEFSRAAKAGKLIRQGIPTLLQDCKDPKLSSRMLKTLFDVLKTDTVNPRGTRTVAGGDVMLLEGMSFNINSHLDNILATPHTATFTRSSGVVDITLTDFIPTLSISAPANTTHFKIVSAGMDINFSSGETTVAIDDSGAMPYGNSPTGAISLNPSVAAASTNPIFILLGVRFYEEVNGVQYPLKDSSYNPLAIVKVSKA